MKTVFLEKSGVPRGNLFLAGDTENRSWEIRPNSRYVLGLWGRLLGRRLNR